MAGFLSAKPQTTVTGAEHPIDIAFKHFSAMPASACIVRFLLHSFKMCVPLCCSADISAEQPFPQQSVYQQLLYCSALMQLRSPSIINTLHFRDINTPAQVGRGKQKTAPQKGQKTPFTEGSAEGCFCLSDHPDTTETIKKPYSLVGQQPELEYGFFQRPVTTSSRQPSHVR